MSRSKIVLSGPLARTRRGCGHGWPGGYAEASQTACVRLCAVLSRWLQARRVDPAMLSDRRVARFAAEHRVADGHVPGLAPVLRYLRTTGVIPAGGEPGLVDREVEAFRRYLNEARSSRRPRWQRCDVVRRFLSAGEVDGTLELSGLRVVEVHRFVMAEAARLRRGSITAVLHAMRSFLRYLFVVGVTATDLSGGLPAVTARPHAELPRTLDPATLTALLGCCDRSSRVGLRDVAILLLMSRLGLRAIEISTLRLDDIDWRAGELLVHRKGGYQETLPLPVDVGRALVAYLQDGRPATASRAVFMRAVAPTGPLSRNGVVFVPRSAARRAGLPVVGAHQLRHTAATSMLRSGASLRAVGQVLGHHRDQTTAIYASVAPGTLERVVRAWPEAGQ